MFKRILIFSTLVLVAPPFALASDREDDAARAQKAAQVFKAIMPASAKNLMYQLHTYTGKASGM
jgi:hypothetical protein